METLRGYNLLNTTFDRRSMPTGWSTWHTGHACMASAAFPISISVLTSTSAKIFDFFIIVDIELADSDQQTPLSSSTAAMESK